MTAEVLIAIAMLCQVPNGVAWNWASEIAERQLKCQKYYAACVGKEMKMGGPPAKMVDCIASKP